MCVTSDPDLSFLLVDPGATGERATGIEEVLSRSRRVRARRRRRLAAALGAGVALVGAGLSLAILPTSPRPGTEAAGSRAGPPPPGLRWLAVSTGAAAPGTSPGSKASVTVPGLRPGTSAPPPQCLLIVCGAPSGARSPLVVASGLEPLFVRTHDGVTLRVFEAITTGTLGLDRLLPTATTARAGQADPSSGALPRCTPEFRRELVVEVEAPDLVATLEVPFGISSGHPVQVLAAQRIAVTPGGSLEVVAAEVSSKVSSVGARSRAGAADEMGVVQGWAVLVLTAGSPAPSPPSRLPLRLGDQVSVQARGPSGTVLEAVTLAYPTALALAGGVPACPQLGRPLKVGGDGHRVASG